MAAKRKNGFETLDISNKIDVHGNVMLLFSDESPMPESWKNYYNKNWLIIHASLFVILFAANHAMPKL